MFTKLNQFQILYNLIKWGYFGQNNQNSKKQKEIKNNQINLEDVLEIIINLITQYLLYSKNRIKQGIWIEEIQQTQFQLVEIGEYFNGQRIGKWKCFQNDKQIAGGFYDDEGIKKGKWIELWKFFNSLSLMIQNGEYNMNGLKIGRWDIIYKRQQSEVYKQMQIIYQHKGFFLFLQIQWQWII
ncbi:unnamed protein product [Paramecium sonneborni]|uniref:Uncharacterized protein n=1 Tax=Paramecium sonneborni TaxID=65129 RepID=A0A8S1RRM3_9CILI|nr:unnamed protein product [Paramecium sonneborni]